MNLPPVCKSQGYRFQSIAVHLTNRPLDRLLQNEVVETLCLISGISFTNKKKHCKCSMSNQ
jgi:hypothetical protein